PPPDSSTLSLHDALPISEGHLAAEQAVDALALVDEVGAEIGDEQQVGLAGLNEHAHRHASIVQIPGVGADVGLRPDGALLPDGADRKSTRLNSSHVKISY